MIRVIDAPPGSGKTYYVVNYISKYWTYDKLYDEYIVKSDVLIITNIEGFKPRHWKLEKCLSERTHQEFFSIENFKAIQEKTGKKHIILAIDEAHKIFPAGYKDSKVYEFFAEHRHYGIDIIFMTQGLSEFTRIFNPLYEDIMTATPRSKGVAGVFTYTRKSKSGQYYGSEVVKKKKEIFHAYISMHEDEKNKPKNAYVQWIVIMVVFFGGGLFLFKSALAGIESKSADKKNTAIANERKMQQKINPALPPAAQTASGIPAVAPASLSPTSVTFPDLPALPAVSPDVLVKKWRNYYVDAVIYDGDDTIYMIEGRVVDTKLTRNFDKHNLSIQYFTTEMEQPAQAKPSQVAPSKT